MTPAEKRGAKGQYVKRHTAEAISRESGVPVEHALAWAEFSALAAKPIRTDADDLRIADLRARLDAAGIKTWDPVPREDVPPCLGD
jgi:hypothetical protein